MLLPETRRANKLFHPKPTRFDMSDHWHLLGHVFERDPCFSFFQPWTHVWSSYPLLLPSQSGHARNRSSRHRSGLTSSTIFALEMGEYRSSMGSMWCKRTSHGIHPQDDERMGRSKGTVGTERMETRNAEVARCSKRCKYQQRLKNPN